MKPLLLILVFCSCVYSQQNPSSPARPDPAQFKTYEAYIEAIVDWKLKLSQTRAATAVRPGTLSACKVKLKDALDASDMVSTDLTNLRAENEALSKANTELRATDADLTKKMEDLRSAAMEVLNFNERLQTEFKKTVEERNALADRYNAVLSEANAQLQLANTRLARQNQINNALAIYSLMPKYTPPQTLNVTVSDCTRLPALCVH